MRARPVHHPLVLGAALLCAAGAARADPLWPYLGAEGHASAFTGSSSSSMLGVTTGYGFRAGYRLRERLGLFLHVEQNLWFTSELGRTMRDGALNLGLGADLLSFGGRVRTSVAVGPSVLLFRTFFDEAGSVGLFLDVRFFGYRFALGRWLRLILDPISVTLVAPVLGHLRIALVEYRMVVGLELGR